MRLTLLCAMLLGSGVLMAIFVTNLSRLVSVGSDSSRQPAPRSSRPLNISDSPHHLFWFLQISDLHISSFQDPSRVANLRQFCDSTVTVIQPSVVLATGDLTDAKEADNVGSRQILEEWISYREVLSNCRALDKVKWLDIRGNHDNFDVPGTESERNLYRNYSGMGGGGSSFSHSVRTAGGMEVTFIGVDACPRQGLRRPFNFVGLLTGDQAVRLRSIVASHPHTHHFVWFGHYPTSCVMSQSDQMRDVIGEDERSLVYLCGHLHTLGGIVPNMYTLQKRGFLELELADWKDNRMYRLLAIDHGLLSFTDVKFEDWPVILVTNPKAPLFASNREPTANILTSQFIRVLVFSPGKVLHVGISLQSNDWQPCTRVSGPLFTLPWDPSRYNTGLHRIKVSAVDDLGNEKSIVHEFSVDGTQYNYGLLARICLMTNISSVSQLLFGFMIVGCTLPLGILRYMRRWSNINSGGYKLIAEVEIKLIRVWLRRLSILSNIDRFFYPITGYPLYLTIGPWFVGELIRDYLGVVFVWGIFINNSFLPGAFTYTFAFKQLLFFHTPFILVTSYLLDIRLCSSVSMRLKAVLHTLMLMLVLSQIYLVYYFWLAYGTVAVLLGPYRLYPVCLYIYSWLQSQSVPDTHIRDVVHPWIKES